MRVSAVMLSACQSANSCITADGGGVYSPFEHVVAKVHIIETLHSAPRGGQCAWKQWGKKFDRLDMQINQSLHQIKKGIAGKRTMHTSQCIVFKTQQAQCLHAFPLCSQRPYIALKSPASAWCSHQSSPGQSSMSQSTSWDQAPSRAIYLSADCCPDIAILSWTDFPNSLAMYLRWQKNI